MASSDEETDISIKHESPYSSDPVVSQVLISPQSPSLKRRRPDQSQDFVEKRQRIDSGSSASEPLEAPMSDGFAAMLAQATGAVMQQHASNGNGLQTSQEKSRDSGPLVSSNEQDRHSTQILSTLAQGPWFDTIQVVQSPNSELGQAYATLKSLFDQTKKIYSQTAQFLSADELNIQEAEHRATIRITNLATFVSAVYGGGNVGFYELNDHFIETFTPDGTPMSKEAGDLFLSLKTQMFLSAVTQEEQERTKEDILEDFFPLGLDELLQGRHLDSPLAESELEFLEASQTRRDFLMNEANNLDSIQDISSKFAWEDFLQSLTSHLSKTYEPLLTPYMKRHALTAPESPIRGPPQNAAQSSDNQAISFEEQVELAAQAALKAALQPLSANQQLQQSESPLHVHIQHPQHKATPNISGIYPSPAPPHHTQSAPTQVLYERARQAAVSKANTGNARRPGLPSQRRPWTTEEENALMTGLDLVKGPHWSQILALYGQGGSIDDVLKDRNQVQLKDKARNLKLFFLKSNIEVPYFLQSVTGELKTRAPTQAARKEAEARQKLASTEEQNRVNGILTLAQGLQEHTHGNPASASTSPPGGNSPLNVVEPDDRDYSLTPSPLHQTADEHLRVSLMAANANPGATAGTSVVGTAKMI